MRRISAHFTEIELIRSQTAARLGISNAPNDMEFGNLVDTASFILEPPRLHFDIMMSPSSGFRCRELEIVICKGAITRYLRRHPDATVEDYLKPKQHPKGQAVDFTIPGVPNFELAQWMSENCEYDQIILEYPDPKDPFAGWVHGSYNRQGNRRELLTATRGGYVRGLVI